MYKTILISIFLFCFNAIGVCLNYAPAKDVKSGKWGYVDENGKERTKFKYDLAFNFSYGKALALRKGAWYFIDKQKFKEEMADTFLQSYFNYVLEAKYNFSEVEYKKVRHFDIYNFLNPTSDCNFYYCESYGSYHNYRYFHLIEKNKILVFDAKKYYRSPFYIYDIEKKEKKPEFKYHSISKENYSSMIFNKGDFASTSNPYFISNELYLYNIKADSMIKIDLKDSPIRFGYNEAHLMFFQELSSSCFYLQLVYRYYDILHSIDDPNYEDEKLNVFVILDDTVRVQMNIEPQDETYNKYEPFGKIPSNCKCHYDSSFISELKKLEYDYLENDSFQNGYTQIEFQEYHLFKKHTSPEEWSKMTLTQFKVINGELRYGAIREDKWVVEPKYAHIGVFN